MDCVDVKNIETMIYVIRGAKVMLDSDLAELYAVETGHLNRQVRRNIERFPSDFMFQLTVHEYESLKYKDGPLKSSKGGRQYLPFVFTENGVAMLSGILNSPRAIEVNIAIMRIFTRLRSFLMLEHELKSEMKSMKENTNQMFQIVFERLDSMDELATENEMRKRRIGL